MDNKLEIWIDTNIIIYVLRTNKEYSAQARQLVQEAKVGNFTLKVSPLVIAECVFVLSGQQFKLNKEEVKTILISFINLKGVDCEEKAVVEEALTQFTKKGIDFVDAYLAAHARAVTPNHVISINVKDFIKIGIGTVETPNQLLDRVKPDVANGGES